MLLLTGHTGFIGTHLANSLVDDGVTWIGLDRSGVGPEEGDVRQAGSVVTTESIEMIIHLASPTGVADLSTSTTTYDEILDGAQAVADLSSAHSAKVLFFSSSEVYGEVSGRIEATTPLAPLSAYGRAKADAEELLRERVSELVVLRPFNVFGPGQRAGFVIPNILDALRSRSPLHLVGGGAPIRQFTQVADVVEAVRRLRSSWPQEHRTINLAGPSAASIADVVALAAALLAVEPQVIEVDPSALGRDQSVEIEVRHVRQDSIDGWLPTGTLESGLAHLIELDEPGAIQRIAQ